MNFSKNNAILVFKGLNQILRGNMQGSLLAYIQAKVNCWQTIHKLSTGQGLFQQWPSP